MKQLIVIVTALLTACASQPPAAYCQGDWRCEHLTSRGMTAPGGTANWSPSGTVAREYRGSVQPVIVVRPN